MSPQRLQIGVMLEAVQLSDIMGADLFGSISKEYVLASIPLGAPEFLLELAPDIEFHFLATTMEPGFMTPGIRYVPTTTYDECRRDLDVLLVGGPLLTHRPPQAERFLQEAMERTEVVMSVCIGGLWLADAGVLKGRKATVNRGALEMARKLHPDVEWVDQRWVVDGKLWTAGAAGCGVDMVIEYLKGKFDARLVGMALEALQLGTEKGINY